MKCSSELIGVMGYLSTFALLLTLFGLYLQGIHIVKKKKTILAIFPALIMVSHILKLPTQICIALTDPYGWYSVIGIIIKILSYGIITYLSYLY